MYVEGVPNRNSPPAILLRETYRQDGKVRKRTLLNLSDWPRERADGLRALQIKIADDRFAYCRNQAEIAAETARDGICVIRTNVPADAMTDLQVVA